MYSKIREILKNNQIMLSNLKSQHFLISEVILREELIVGNVNNKDEIVEVGAGIGTLTKLLAESAKKVIAVEKDEKLIPLLKNELKDFENVEIINEDILKLDNTVFNNRKIVSNPPYHIVSPLLMNILDSKYQICVITLQLEYGNRLKTNVGSSNYSRLTVRMNYNSEVKIIHKIGKENFYPVPRVDSVLVKIEPVQPIVQITNKKLYFSIINELFIHKNQLVRKVIKNKFRKLNINPEIIYQFLNNLPFKEARIRNLDHPKLKEIFGYITNNDELKIYWNI